MADDYTRTMEVANVKKNFYVSAVNTLQIHWYSGNGMSSFNLQYKTGKQKFLCVSCEHTSDTLVLWEWDV